MGNVRTEMGFWKGEMKNSGRNWVYKKKGRILRRGSSGRKGRCRGESGRRKG